MKIAMVCQSYPPMVSGAAICAERLARHLAQSGHKVLVLSASDQPYPYQVSEPNLLVKRISSIKNPLRVRQRFILWPHRQVVKSLVEFAPDVIHLNDPLQIAISSISFARSRNIPVILTVHALPWAVSETFQLGKGIKKIADFVLWSYARWLLKRCNAAVIPTQSTADVLFAHTGIRTLAISNGIDLCIFQPFPADDKVLGLMRSSLGLPERAPVILYVGRLDKDKQVEKAIQAAAVSMRQNEAHLLIVGDGTERTKLIELCAQLGIADRSHFPGFVSVKEGLVTIYQLASIFITTCDLETQGIVLMEAAACGLPIITVQATCLPELVHEGQNGYLLPVGDYAGMATRINELIQDPSKAQAMGRLGRQVVEKHAIADTFAAYEDLYRTALQKSGLRAHRRKNITERWARLRRTSPQ